MARGRKSQHIKVLTGKDQELLRGLGQVGISSKSQIKSYLNDRDGQRYCHNQLGIEFLYRWNSRQLPHDLKLAEAYYNFPIDIRHTWRNEYDLLMNDNDNRKDVRDRMLKSSTPTAKVRVEQMENLIFNHCKDLQVSNLDIDRFFLHPSQSPSQVLKLSEIDKLLEIREDIRMQRY